MRRLLRRLAVVLVALIMALVIGLPIQFVLQIPWYLVTGWFSCLWRTVPGVQWDGLAILSAVAVTAVLTATLQLTARHLRPDWSWSATGRVMAGLILAFAITLAAIGLVAQVSHPGRAWIGQEWIPLRSMLRNRVHNALAEGIDAKERDARMRDAQYWGLSQGLRLLYRQSEEPVPLVVVIGPEANEVHVQTWSAYSRIAPEALPALLAQHPPWIPPAD